MIVTDLARAHRHGRRPQAPAELRCKNCGAARPAGACRCDECAAFHRVKDRTMEADRRAACGLLARVCSVCEGTCPGRHNRRTCPLRVAESTGKATSRTYRKSMTQAA